MVAQLYSGLLSEKPKRKAKAIREVLNIWSLPKVERQLAIVWLLHRYSLPEG